jgi:hypothetical protein
MMNGEKDFLVVVTGIGLTVDHQKTKLAAISPQRQIPARPGMRVIPPRARRLRRVGVAQVPTRRNHRRSLFHRPIVQRVNRQPMPVHNVGIRRSICHIDVDRHALFQPQERPRHLAVVGGRLHHHARRNLQIARLNFQCVIGFGRLANSAVPECGCSYCSQRGALKKSSPVHGFHRNVFTRPRVGLTVDPRELSSPNPQVLTPAKDQDGHLYDDLPNCVSMAVFVSCRASK